jgi:hypothetical protein
MKRVPTFVFSHGIVLLAGVAIGIYLLPILTAPPPPTAAAVAAGASDARYTAEFRRDLKDSDLLHRGEGKVAVGARAIALQGRLAPGPDYKLYLSPKFVETESDFARVKPRMARVGDVKTFDGFVAPVPDGIDAERYHAVIVWCETFGQFITTAKYR